MDIKNIVSFGAKGRIEKKLAEYEETMDGFNQLLQQVEVERETVNGALERLIETKRQALLSLKSISRISSNLSSRDRDLVESYTGLQLSYSFDQVSQTISAGDIAISSAKGMGAGVSTALGAWAIVGTFGTASTGTVITSLSGAAMTNATLAYLGGGSLAAGGGGIAAGTAVLGGLVVIPALVLTGVFSHVMAHKKIKEIEEKEYEIVKAMEECHQALTCFDLIVKRSDEIIQGVQVARMTFETELERVYRLIYPHILSRFIKATRKFFGGRYFSPNDLEHVAFIGEVASSLARIIDQKILDANGKPV